MQLIATGVTRSVIRESVWMSVCWTHG